MLRLVDILNFINTNDLLSSHLVLKGGTAINLIVFNLPRLSVDIDLDFSFTGTKEEMLIKRKEINFILFRFMKLNGYSLNYDTKNKHALDSFIFNYVNYSNNKDNLKIEINYMNRIHIFDPIYSNININFIESTKILTLNKYELFGSKIKALIERCTIRDVYDVYKMITSNIFNSDELKIVKKCFIFYLAIGKTTNSSYTEILNDFHNKIQIYNTNKIPQYLSSTLNHFDNFHMICAFNAVNKFINDIINFTNNEITFLNCFENNLYDPSLLFDDKEIINKLINHPMALWKTANKNKISKI